MESYVVVARTNSGSYFVSEEIFTQDYLEKVRDKFQGMVDYFGGGRVMVYKNLPSYMFED